MFTRFYKGNLEEFREEFAKSIKDFEKKFGVKMKVGHISYAEREMTVSIDVKINTPGVDNEKILFLKNCNYHHYVKPEMYLKKFIDKNKTYQIVGCSATSNKYPLICNCLTNGKTSNYNAAYVGKLLGLND